MLDVIIKNGKIVDGSGNPWFRADLGIAGGKIVCIGDLQEETAGEIIDAKDLVVAPGFIDIHCHSDAVIFGQPREKGKIVQGVTTEVIGNCGASATPVKNETLASLQRYLLPVYGAFPLAWDWTSTGEYLDRIEEHEIISNIATLVGHGTVRTAVMDFDNRPPTPEEMEEMKKLVAQSLEEGAFGLSSGLIYPPGVFSQPAEMIELCKVVAEKGGFYATHLRNEAEELIEAVQEALDVVKATGVSLEISHHKAAGRANWGKCRQTLDMIDATRRDGFDVTCDVYPYIASNTSLGTLLPPWMQEGGIPALLERLEKPEIQQRIKRELITGISGWENYPKSAGWNGVMVAYCQNNKSYEGKTLQEIADEYRIDPPDALFKLLLEEKANALMNLFSMTEEDVSYVLKHPVSMVASDAIPSTGKPHPRFFGTFPRVLSKYVRQDQVLRLEEAVRKMTSLPAQRLGLRDRGKIGEGMWADIVVFNPATVEDKAVFTNPQQYPVGIEYVLVNGQTAVRNSQYTGALAGKVLRKGR